jgi:hypothetical protein
MKNNKVYHIEDWCGEGPRVIYHPRGLPPSWTETNVPEETEREVLHKVAELGPPFHRYAVHFSPDLEHLDSFPIR